MQAILYTSTPPPGLFDIENIEVWTPRLLCWRGIIVNMNNYHTEYVTYPKDYYVAGIYMYM